MAVVWRFLVTDGYKKVTYCHCNMVSHCLRKSVCLYRFGLLGLDTVTGLIFSSILNKCIAFSVTSQELGGELCSWGQVWPSSLETLVSKKNSHYTGTYNPHRQSWTGRRGRWCVPSKHQDWLHIPEDLKSEQHHFGHLKPHREQSDFQTEGVIIHSTCCVVGPVLGPIPVT